MKNKEEIFLGIDPGTVIMGYGLISVENKKMNLLEMGVLKLGGYKDHAKRLQLIHEKILSIFNQYQITSCAIEAPFFGKNVQSMLKLGRAQGVAMAAVMQHKIEITEYLPKKVKVAVCGNGNASKEQISKTLMQLLKFDEQHKYLDASDALAVAVCHYFQSTSVLGKSLKKNDWSSFIKNNSHRIKK
ncbi:MAG: crossover junction endodeoxyribonuclease RuvC [Chitinophagaceae bacterium]|nr:crossover junction endodeoxyribonuclease RuvC [Chitinophagaceae bacterium]